jgi:hypothetical protein
VQGGGILDVSKVSVYVDTAVGLVLEFPQVEQVGRECKVFASGFAHRDSLSRCLSNGLCKGDDGLFKFSCVLYDLVRVEGEVQGGSEERPVGMLVIIRQFGSG